MYDLANSENDSEKQFCSIDYVDNEGDRVIKHAFLSIEEQQKIIDECVKCGIQAKIYILSNQINF